MRSVMTWYEIANYARPTNKRELARGQYDYISNHYLPEPLLLYVRNDLKSRGLKYLRVRALKHNQPVCIDVGGMIMTDRDERLIEIDDIKIHFPTGRCLEILRHFEESKLRRIPGILSYYKTHFWFRRSICFFPRQQKFMIQQLKDMLPECEAIAAIENEEFNRRIKRIPVPHAIQPRPVRMQKGNS